MNYNNSKLLKFEKMHEREYYAITINPDDEHQYWHHIGRLEDYVDKTKQLIYKCTNDSAYFELIPEVSPLGRLHYHGYFKLFDKIEFYLHSIYKLLKWAHLEIDTLSDDLKWEDYILKQVDLHSYCLKNNIYLPIKVGNDFKKMTKDFFTNEKDQDVIQ